MCVGVSTLAVAELARSYLSWRRNLTPRDVIGIEFSHDEALATYQNQSDVIGIEFSHDEALAT